MAMEMRGSLNLSKFKTNERQPKYYGRALINGITYNIKGWIKEGPNGDWISLLFEDKTADAAKLEEEFAPTKKPLNPVCKNYINDDPF